MLPPRRSCRRARNQGDVPPAHRVELPRPCRHDPRRAPPHEREPECAASPGSEIERCFMRVPSLTMILCVLIALPATRAAEPPARPRDEREAIRTGLAYVEGKSLNWLRERKCASCHHVPMMVWV